MTSFFFAQADHLPSVVDFLLWPGLLVFCAIIAWLIAFSGRRRNEVKKWRWFLAYGFLCLAIFFGIQTLLPFLNDDFKASLLYTRRLRLSAWAGVLLPLIVGIVFAIGDFLEVRRSRSIVIE